MHIIAGLVAVVGAVLVILWRIQQASSAVRDIGEAAEDARGLWRLWSWRRKTNVHPLDAITDPREAAVAMMAATAEADGALTEREPVAITRLAGETLGASSAQAQELLAQARWLTQGRTDLGETYRRLMPPIRKACSAQEQQQLVEMLRTVATAEGPIDQTVKRDIDWLAQSLK